MVFAYDEYDKVGNRRSITDSDGEQEYTYDELYQLKVGSTSSPS